MTSLGGSTCAWGSAPIVILATAAAAFLVGWALVERHTVEPIMPLRPFANPVFSLTSAVGFVEGFAAVWRDQLSPGVPPSR